jgi:predicted CoA-binding protein
MYVAVVGASDNKERYSYKAFSLLKEYGYHPIPVHPVLEQIDGEKVYKTIEEIPVQLFAITLYVRPHIGETYIESMKKMKPEKVVMNPGTESDLIEEQLSEAGIYVQRACSLVLLRSSMFSEVA